MQVIYFLKIIVGMRNYFTFFYIWIVYAVSPGGYNLEI